MSRKRGFGRIQTLPSGRVRARYSGPDGALHNAPTTFDTRLDAEAWLTDERRLISAGTWTSPTARLEAARTVAVVVEATRMPTFTKYATTWIAERKVKGRPLAPRTRDHYQQLLEDYLAPAFGKLAIDQITPGAVNLWYDNFTPKRKKSHGKKTKGDTARAHTYSLARAIMNTAVSAHGPLVGQVNPFAVRGGGSSPNNKRQEVATAEQLDTILNEIRPQWQALILIATWCGLRYSEIAALQRSDVDLTNSVVKVRRAVSRSRIEGVGIKAPKSEAGVRDIHIPEHALAGIKTHLRTYVNGRNGLLFPGHQGQHLAPATFYGGRTRKVKGKRVKVYSASGWYAARTAAGCPELHFHDLRATGATLMAQLGATEAEIQAFLGDSTPQAAQRYVRAAQSRMKKLAAQMSDLAATGDW